MKASQPGYGCSEGATSKVLEGAGVILCLRKARLQHSDAGRCGRCGRKGHGLCPQLSQGPRAASRRRHYPREGGLVGGQWATPVSDGAWLVVAPPDRLLLRWGWGCNRQRLKPYGEEKAEPEAGR